MKILFYGAGALASLLAARLAEAGQQVTVLARGHRLASIQRDGLVLCDLISGDCHHTRVAVVDSLKKDDAYDLVIVLMGKHHLSGVLPVLAANHAVPTYIFLGNNVAGQQELAQAVGQERLLMGFFGAAGKLEDDVAFTATRVGRTPARLVLGDPFYGLTPRLDEVATLLETSGFAVERHPNIDAWLKTHAATVLAVTGAYYLVGRDFEALQATRDAQVLMLRGMKEAILVLRALHLEITPSRLWRLARLPEPLRLAMIRRLAAQPDIRLGLIHADGMRPELQQLAAEFGLLAQRAGRYTPHLDRLTAAFNDSVPPIPSGSASLSLDWRGVYAALAAFTALLALTFGLRRGRRRR